MLQFTGLIGRDERGQGLAEYALILALIAVVAIAALIFLGGQISAISPSRSRMPPMSCGFSSWMALMASSS